MYWTLELASYLSDAPWPATKDELIDFSIRTGAPLEVVENLQSMEDEGDVYESIEEIWPDFPSDEDYLWEWRRILVYNFLSPEKILFKFAFKLKILWVYSILF